MDTQPHNNLWAEKLLQVSMPDSGEAWAGMEAALDRELPRHVRGQGRRWLLLILLLLLLIGVCNCPGRGRFFHGAERRPRTTSANITGGLTPATRTLGSRPASPATTPANSAGPAAPLAPGATAATPAGPGATPQSPGSQPATPAARRMRPGPMPPSAGPTPTASGPTIRRDHPSRAISRKTSGLAKTPIARKGKNGMTHHRHPAGTTPAAYGDITQTEPGDAARGGIGANAKAATNAGHGPGRQTNFNNGTARRNAPALTRLTPRKDSLRKEGLHNGGLRKDSLRRDNPHKESLHKDSLLNDSLSKDSLHKNSLRKDNPRKDNLRKDSTHKTPPAPPQEPEEKHHGWVVGVGLNQFFPLGDQRGSTYNSNGLTGTLTDYLPVPMIRYYLNRKVYLQVEMQFNTPQPTAKNLVISQPAVDTSTRSGVLTRVATSASIQQLYYFNVPLSIHFNPWDNLAIGTGLQWSHLSNAIGEFDSSTSTSFNGNTPTVVDAKTTHSFKGDTLYQRIRTNEFRFLFDMNYTYKHWVLGLRYNQALSKFVNLQLPTGGTTQARNSSLQLYLRYILWDTRRKKNSPGPP